MAHFAKVDENNIVQSIHVVDNIHMGDPENEAIGIAYLNKVHGDGFTWVQTSYNVGIRKNYATRGSTYDIVRDAFIPRKNTSRDSWVLDEDTCQWKAPVEYPDDGNEYLWDEDTLSWAIIENPKV
jgi:hypothetical protein